MNLGYYQSTIAVLAAVLIAGGILFAFGCIEKKRNDRNAESIPIRINVNGIRGKSTATRLITSILTEAGYKTMGKTTGTAARLIYWNGEEKPIIRKPRGVSISEQIHVIGEAASENADALVCECMAVRPDYQKVYQHQMLKSNLTVIINVLEDHLAEMGPTTEQIAWAFAETIPYNGKAVIPDCEFTEYFQKTAEERSTETFIIDDSEISHEFIEQFSYRIFEHNCATALAAARALGIPDDTAYRGMLKAAPDPGTLCIYNVRNDAVFVNAFAANEPSSTLEIWNSLKDEGLNCENPVVVMNCRPDRADRTLLFIDEFLPFIPNMTLLVIGEKTRDCVKAWKKGRFENCTEFKCIEGKNISKIMDYLEPVMAGRLILGVGNIHGIGVPFIDAVVGNNNASSEIPV